MTAPNCQSFRHTLKIFNRAQIEMTLSPPSADKCPHPRRQQRLQVIAVPEGASLRLVEIRHDPAGCSTPVHGVKVDALLVSATSSAPDSVDRTFPFHGSS